MPPPLRRPASVSISENLRSVRPHADWADKNLGNGDGTLDSDELDAFERGYGSIEGMSERVIAPLRRALRAPAPAPETAVTPAPGQAPTTEPATFTVAQLLRGEHKTVAISAVPDTGSARFAARLADEAYGNGDGQLSTSELRGLRNVAAYASTVPQLEEALRTRGTDTPDPTAPPPAGAPAMGVAVSSVSEGLRPVAQFADQNGNGDGVLDTREVTAHAQFVAAHSGGAALSESNLGMLRLMYRLTNAGTPVAGITMRADGTGAAANWPPPASRMLAEATELTPERRALANRIVRAAGHATAEDVAAVAEHVARLPMPVLRALDERKIPIRVGRESVVDVVPSLANETPRGWHEGRTFHDVPGIYHPESRSVIVSTEASASGGRMLSDDHGSLDLLVHEIGHALDLRDAFGLASGAVSDSREFRQAYDTDRANLQRLGRTYLTQEGEAGREEAFAEAFAAYVSGNQFMPETTPNLRAYFDRLFERVER